MDEDDIECVCSAIVVCMLTRAGVMLLNKEKRRSRRWCREWIHRRIRGRGVVNMLNQELRSEDPNSYKNFLRLSVHQFNFLLNLLDEDIRKEVTFMREPISTTDKLQITLRFLATGESYRSLMYSTRVHESTISRFVPLVCTAIIQHLSPKYLKTPDTEEEWKKIAQEFYDLWNFPHCIGALDGRHINFRPPISDGAYYYNYKGTHSIVLLALCDAKYRFTYVNLGVNGRVSDGGIFHRSSLARALNNNSLNIPPPDFLPGTRNTAPYVIVADDAFPLLINLMKPYPQRGLCHDTRIFNYRLSRARRMIENSFGMLANRFRVLLNPINLCVNKVQIITHACVVLHNYLCHENDPVYNNGNIFTEETSVPLYLETLCRQGSNNSSNSARDIRNNYKMYFNSPEGAVAWQEDSVKTHNL
ncbi:putative nuclease HARBI1 [Photinus pyralis]|nr:putative nuclease HARBI1 [Photinus pyralis]